MVLSKNQLYTLSNIFSTSIIKELLKFGFSNKLLRILDDINASESIKNKKLSNVYDWAYKTLEKQYPNEYIYKNILANKILLGIHSLNTSFMLTELRVNNSKADCVIINGTLTVYEIKTKYDTLQRLSKQLDDYKKVFEKIYIITDETNKEKLAYLKNDGIGLKHLNPNGRISTIHEALSQIDNIDLTVIFDILRQNEYLHIIKKLCGEKPSAPNTKIYKVCKEIFSKLDKQLAYKEVIEILKKRGENQKLKDFINEVPKSLKIRAIESNLSTSDKIKFLELLNSTTSKLLKKV